jgi:hypothetical protein
MRLRVKPLKPRVMMNKNTKLNEIPCSVRMLNVMKKLNIDDVGGVVELYDKMITYRNGEKVLWIPRNVNFGKRTLTEIQELIINNDKMTKPVEDTKSLIAEKRKEKLNKLVSSLYKETNNPNGSNIDKLFKLNTEINTILYKL